MVDKEDLIRDGVDLEKMSYFIEIAQDSVNPFVSKEAAYLYNILENLKDECES